MKKSNDDLSELLRQFVADSAADSMVEEIRSGDAMLDRYPAPVLSPAAAARIRGRLGMVRAGHRRRTVFGWATVAAAAVAVIVFLFGDVEMPSPVQPENAPVAQSQSLTPNPPLAASGHLPVYLANLWDDASRGEGDESFVAMKIELDNIAAMIEAVSFKKSDASGDCPPDGEEPERMENQINTTDFWQG